MQSASYVLKTALLHSKGDSTTSKLLVIKILITLLSSRSDHLRYSLLSDLRLLLRRLRFLLGWGSHLNRRSLVLLRGDFFAGLASLLSSSSSSFSLSIPPPRAGRPDGGVQRNWWCAGCRCIWPRGWFSRGGDENVDWELGFIFGEAAKGDGEFDKMFLIIWKVTIFGILLL